MNSTENGRSFRLFLQRFQHGQQQNSAGASASLRDLVGFVREAELGELHEVGLDRRVPAVGAEADVAPDEGADARHQHLGPVPPELELGLRAAVALVSRQ